MGSAYHLLKKLHKLIAEENFIENLLMSCWNIRRSHFSQTPPHAKAKQQQNEAITHLQPPNVS
jgi:hypothetical protein